MNEALDAIRTLETRERLGAVATIVAGDGIGTKAVLDAEAPHLIPQDIVRPEPNQMTKLVGRLLGT